MTFQNPSPAGIASLLRAARTIAVVGLSADASRPSHGVAAAATRARAAGLQVVIDRCIYRDRAALR